MSDTKLLEAGCLMLAERLALHGPSDAAYAMRILEQVGLEPTNMIVKAATNEDR